MYDFVRQLEIGEGKEELLDRFFSQHVTLERATKLDQSMGIDRLFKTPFGWVPVEYKCDFRALHTGNIFIEIVSVCIEGKPDKLGWLYTSQATWLIYWVYPGKKLCFRMSRLRKQADALYRFREVTIPNNGYSTKGLIVPIKYISAFAVQPDRFIQELKSSRLFNDPPITLKPRNDNINNAPPSRAFSTAQLSLF